MDFWTEKANRGSHGVLFTLYADTDAYLPTEPSEPQKPQVKRRGRKKERKREAFKPKAFFEVTGLCKCDSAVFLRLQQWVWKQNNCGLILFQSCSREVNKITAHFFLKAPQISSRTLWRATPAPDPNTGKHCCSTDPASHHGREEVGLKETNVYCCWLAGCDSWFVLAKHPPQPPPKDFFCGDTTICDHLHRWT